MTDLAPWEGGTRPAKHTSGIAKAYKLPPDAKLPDIYKAEASEFIAGSGRSVPRPPPVPRKLEKNAQLALLVLAGAALLGALVVLFSFTMLTPEAGAIRYIYAAGGSAIALVALVALVIELPRMSVYRAAGFMPGVLVFGNRAQFEKVIGPGGINAVLGQRARGSGAGILNKVFDRSAHVASPPEVVALHCDRGAGPELVGIEWNAVRELQRGDIVWFRIRGMSNYLMFHKMIPYAPRILTDPATRNEIFTALKVGVSLFRNKPVSKNMGTTKVLHKDADGKIFAAGPAPGRPQSDVDVPLAGGNLLGADDQVYQGAHEEPDEPEAHGPTGTHIYGIGEPSDTEKVNKPWDKSDA